MTKTTDMNIYPYSELKLNTCSISRYIICLIWDSIRSRNRWSSIGCCGEAISQMRYSAVAILSSSCHPWSTWPSMYCHILPSLYFTSSETSLHYNSLCIQSTASYFLFLAIYSAFYLYLTIPCYSNNLPSVLSLWYAPCLALTSIWPIYIALVSLSLHRPLFTDLCFAFLYCSLFCLFYTAPVWAFLHWPHYTASCFAVPSLTSLYCLLFCPPFTDLSILRPVWPSLYWPLYTALYLTLLLLTSLYSPCFVLPSLTSMFYHPITDLF